MDKIAMYPGGIYLGDADKLAILNRNERVLTNAEAAKIHSLKLSNGSIIKTIPSETVLRGKLIWTDYKED